MHVSTQFFAKNFLLALNFLLNIQFQKKTQMIGHCFNSKFFNLNVILKFGKKFSISVSK